MKAVFLDVKNGKPPIAREIDHSLKERYNLIDCRCVDMVRRQIGGKYFIIICDDEGLLKSTPKISAIDDFGQPQLVGNLIICGIGDDEDIADLTPDETEHILNRIQKMYTRMHPNGYYILTQIDY